MYQCFGIGKDGYEILVPQKRMFDDTETPYFFQSEVINFFGKQPVQTGALMLLDLFKRFEKRP